MMAFGAPTKGKPVKGKRPGQPGGADPLALRKRQFDPNDTSIEGNLKQVLSDQGLEEGTEEAPEEDADIAASADAPLVRLVNSLLSEAVRLNASDIHIEPFDGLLRVRFRIDGALREIQKIPYKLNSAITSRLKIMADLDICEKRIPQDGSFSFKWGGVEADFRLSTLPSVFGEKVVMRVMGTTNVNNDLSKLGIPQKQLGMIRDAITRPDGLVLVTGPTGSGKTTTLYAALNELNDISVSVFTAEDPVEGTLQGVTQCQANASIGYTFAAILRSLLRQDPDVILVGEIRDQETAEISIKAALTGHLVLSTLHTNCAVSTISRLLNMGIAPYLITSSVNCVVAQRLVRRICEQCKQEISVPPEMLEKLGPAAHILQGGKMLHGKGCAHCHNSGYKGRAPVYEVLVLSDEMRKLILAGASKEELKRLARLQRMITLREAGLQLVKDGVTSLEEVLGATNEDDGPNDAPLVPQPQTTAVYTQVAVPQTPEAQVAAPAAQVAPQPPVNGAPNGTHAAPVANGASPSPAPAPAPEPGQGEDREKQMAAKWAQAKASRQGAPAA